MSLRRRLLRDLLVGLVVAACWFAGAFWAASATPANTQAGKTFRLVCPLH